jgi:hypothetical protein
LFALCSSQGANNGLKVIPINDITAIFLPFTLKILIPLPGYLLLILAGLINSFLLIISLILSFAQT